MRLGVDAGSGSNARIVMLGQEVGKFLIRRFLEGGLLPQVGRQVRIGLADG